MMTEKEVLERVFRALDGITELRVSGPGTGDQGQDEAELMSRIADRAVRTEVVAFKDTPGGVLTMLPSGTPFTPTTESRWVRDAAAKVFAENRKIQAKQYAGMTLAQKEALARRREREQKA
jgi:hypothetical protein